MKRKTLRHVLEISNPDAVKQSGVIVLDLDDENEALEIARKLALATGRQITLLDGNLALIETIPAASFH